MTCTNQPLSHQQTTTIFHPPQDASQGNFLKRLLLLSDNSLLSIQFPA